MAVLLGTLPPTRSPEMGGTSAPVELNSVTEKDPTSGPKMEGELVTSTVSTQMSPEESMAKPLSIAKAA